MPQNKTRLTEAEQKLKEALSAKSLIGYAFSQFLRERDRSSDYHEAIGDFLNFVVAEFRESVKEMGEGEELEAHIAALSRKTESDE